VAHYPVPQPRATVPKVPSWGETDRSRKRNHRPGPWPRSAARVAARRLRHRASLIDRAHPPATPSNHTSLTLPRDEDHRRSPKQVPARDPFLGLDSHRRWSSLEVVRPRCGRLHLEPLLDEGNRRPESRKDDLQSGPSPCCDHRKNPRIGLRDGSLPWRSVPAGRGRVSARWRRCIDAPLWLAWLWPREPGAGRLPP